jgi:tetratricopeptide (TPR) repeat protein
MKALGPAIAAGAAFGVAAAATEKLIARSRPRPAPGEPPSAYARWERAHLGLLGEWRSARRERDRESSLAILGELAALDRRHRGLGEDWERCAALYGEAAAVAAGATVVDAALESLAERHAATSFEAAVIWRLVLDSPHGAFRDSALLALGDHHLAEGRVEAAKACYRRVIDTSLDNARRAVALLDLGAVLYDEDDHAGAQRLLEQAGELNVPALWESPPQERYAALISGPRPAPFARRAGDRERRPGAPERRRYAAVGAAD